MRGFATSPNPFMTGLKPKSFFGARYEMLKREKMLKSVETDFLPKWEPIDEDSFEQHKAS